MRTLSAGALALAAALPAWAGGPLPQACVALREAVAPDVQITRAENVAAGPAPSDPMAAMTGASTASVVLPAHCWVQGVIEGRTGADGRPYGIRFELRLPQDWRGRLMFQGGGGLDGFLAQAIGRIPVLGATGAPALTRGHAVVSMNGGHDGLDARFAQDQQARLDYAYAAIGKVMEQAKRLTLRYYAAPAAHTYFMGCSNGGREALIAAQRYPLAFDGIVVGNPGFRLSRAAITQSWDTQQFMRIAPRDTQGRPVLSRAFSRSDLALVSRAVIEACDAADGLRDGFINHYAACRFDPAQLQCRPGQSQDCLSPAQVDTLHAVFAGPRDSHGEAIYSSWPYDSGIGAEGWRAWKLGSSEDAARPDALNAVLGADSLRLYFMTPPAPGYDPLGLDLDRDLPRVAQTGALNDATSTFMNSFAAHGGKLLLFQGLSDPVFSAHDLMRWFEALQRDTNEGQAGKTAEWAKLFLVPGMNHCGGGPSLDDFDPLAAIEAWVEQNRAPAQLRATGAQFPGRSQPLCPYPRYARYLGGAPLQATSFACAAPEALVP